MGPSMLPGPPDLPTMMFTPSGTTVTVTIDLRFGSALLVAWTWKTPGLSGAMYLPLSSISAGGAVEDAST